jgi:hypothetical protein
MQNIPHQGIHLDHNECFDIWGGLIHLCLSTLSPLRNVMCRYLRISLPQKTNWILWNYVYHMIYICNTLNVGNCYISFMPYQTRGQTIMSAEWVSSEWMWRVKSEKIILLNMLPLSIVIFGHVAEPLRETHW